MTFDDGWSDGGIERAKARAYHDGQCEMVSSRTTGHEYACGAEAAIDLRDAEIERLRGNVKDVQWVLPDFTCPWCNKPGRIGHAYDCPAFGAATR